MSAPTVATVHSSALIGSIDIRYVPHLDQVELTFWAGRHLVQSVTLSPEHADALAGQLHACVRTAHAEQEATRGSA